MYPDRVSTYQPTRSWYLLLQRVNGLDSSFSTHAYSLDSKLVHFFQRPYLANLSYCISLVYNVLENENTFGLAASPGLN
jgi:hypothetical protein